jgi:hypothetical protein
MVRGLWPCCAAGLSAGPPGQQAEGEDVDVLPVVRTNWPSKLQHSCPYWLSWRLRAKEACMEVAWLRGEALTLPDCILFLFIFLLRLFISGLTGLLLGLLQSGLSLSAFSPSEPA